ncbi:unnamed protein product [Paramecium octaurelia]|uniref:WD40-repeat-containing domain n=1 Tax=Paramecium octaurelia TaxID=43137 RepID=A0A8S1UGS3_PAROT|nr:unnamed protein product [Paramecium octaurelia]
MQQLLQTEEMKCRKHSKAKENLTLVGHIQDDRQLLCDLCNYNGLCQIKLLDLENFLQQFNNQIQFFHKEANNINLLITAAKKITELVQQIEKGLIEIDKKIQQKQKMNQTIQSYLNSPLNEQRLKELLQYLKNNHIDDYKVKSNKSMLENEILQQRKYIQTLNIIQMAQDEINNILVQQPSINNEKEQTLKQVYLFDKQVEQDFDQQIQVYDMQLNNTGMLLAVGSNRIESDGCYAQIWEIDGGVLRKCCSLKGHQREVKTLFFNQEDTVFTGSVDSTIKVWVKQQNENKWDLKQDLVNFHSLAVNCIQLHYSNPNFFASGSEELIIWKKDLLQHGQWVQDSTFKNNKRIISALSFTDKGNLLIVGSDDRLIQILEFAHNQWKLKHKFDQNNKIMQIIPTYNRDFISFQIDGEYTVWKCKSENNDISWNQIQNKHEGQIKKLSFSLTKKLLGVTYEDKKIKLFQIEPDGKLSEKQLDNNEGEIMIMSYLSPSKIVSQNPLITNVGKQGNGNQDIMFLNGPKVQSPLIVGIQGGQQGGWQQGGMQGFQQGGMQGWQQGGIQGLQQGGIQGWQQGGMQLGIQGQQQVSIQGWQQGGNQGYLMNFNPNQQNVKGTMVNVSNPVFNPLRISEMAIEQSKFVKVSKGKLQVYLERSKQS